MEVDVLIVGAGPAGSTTARYCAGRGLEVLIMDRRAEIGHPVQCGEFLPDVREMYSIFPESMNLEELFEIPQEVISRRTEKIDMVSPGGRTYRCDFAGIVLDRKSFDKHLAKLAMEAGARLHTGASFHSMDGDVARTSIGDVRAKVVVGADGPESRTAKGAGLPVPLSRYPAVTAQARGVFDPEVKMFFGKVAPGGYAWIIPKRNGANVGVGFNPRMCDRRPSEVFESFASHRSLNCTDVSMKLIPMSGPVESTVKGRVLLVGDAAGHVMPTNGGGIPTAMIAGRVAGQTIREHLEKGTPLELYERRWRAVMGKPLRDSTWTRKLGDMVFPHDRFLGLMMYVLRRRGLERAIRCRRIPL